MQCRVVQGCRGEAPVGCAFTCSRRFAVAAAPTYRCHHSQAGEPRQTCCKRLQGQAVNDARSVSVSGNTLLLLLLLPEGYQLLDIISWSSESSLALAIVAAGCFA